MKEAVVSEDTASAAKKPHIKKAFVDTIPVMTGYIPLGIGFGIMLQAEGYNYLWAFMMSIVIYAGSMQYLTVGLLASAASPITAALSTLLVSARHLFYGISLIEKYNVKGLKKFYLMIGLSDETYSLVTGVKLTPDIHPHKYYLWVTFFNQVYWAVGCVAGALAGEVIGFDTTGIDFALTALFVTMFIEQWLSTKEHRPALIGLAATGICLFLLGSENFLIGSMIVIILLISILRRKLDVN